MGREPYEVEVGRVVQSACELLQREMDEVFQDLLHRAGTDLRSPYRKPAERANRIVVLCRRLTDEIHRYAAVPWRKDDQEGPWPDGTDGDGFDDDELDF